jgi:hypothetical protein
LSSWTNTSTTAGTGPKSRLHSYSAIARTRPGKFYAQIVDGVMAGTGIDALKKATEKVVPLDQDYEIA